MKASDRIEAIFAAAIDVADEAERRRLVERTCGDDADLRRRVEELLADHAAAGSLLEAPAPAVRDLLAAGAAGDATVGPADRDVTGPYAAEGAGTVVGRYQLLERIGEGGM